MFMQSVLVCVVVQDPGECVCFCFRKSKGQFCCMTHGRRETAAAP